jgi:hypothetical protein
MKNRDVFTINGFPNNFIAAQFWVSTATRNWSTVTKIVEFARMSRPVFG